MAFATLQYTSFVGVVSIFYTTVFVVKRSLDGSYSHGGDFFEVITSSFLLCHTAFNVPPLRGSGMACYFLCVFLPFSLLMLRPRNL